ncbi:hypothetical protein K501DRAFT_338520 [Backusella circina FSU 941]|nr:hypothetical protein K501DRAFT_338520 [Backusella circina FSU 941]
MMHVDHNTKRKFIISINGHITSKYKASCVALQNNTRIYCYSGGYSTLGSASIEAAEPDHHYLDLTQNGLVPGSIVSKWTEIPDDPNFVLEPSIGGTPIKLSDTTYLIDGGYSINAVKKNQTVVYDAVANKWSSISNNGRNVSGSVYGETGVYVTQKQYIAFWGGLIGPNPGTLVNNSVVLHIVSDRSWEICPDVFHGSMSRFGHTVTYNEDRQQILYIGGRTRQLSNPYVPMQNITIFDTITLNWSTKRANSISNITSRFLHTATTLPSSGQILIYGGATDDEAAPKAVADYLYLFNPKTFEYSKISENNTNYSAGPRFGHSGIITSDVYFLSLNGAATTWLNQFRLNVAESPDFSLSVKEIIGITVGSVICVIMIITALWFFVWRDKKKKKQQIEKEDSSMEEEPAYVMENTLNDPIPPPLNVYKPNQIVSNYHPSPLVESQTIKPSL